MAGFTALLEGSAAAHGHLGPGQVVGVRMAMLGCRLIALNNPRERPQIKQLIVYEEIDRCATDAIAYVTGVKLGGVTKGAPAEISGVKAGDVIVELAGRKIENIYDYTYAIEALKVGQETEIKVKRGEETILLKITPASRQ